MFAESQIINGYRVIRLKGSLESCDITALQGEIYALVEGVRGSLAVDLGDVTYIPNTLVVPLLSLCDISRKNNEPLTLINTPSDFRFLLQVAKLDSLFRFIPSADYLEQRPTAASPDFSSPIAKKPVIYDILQKEKPLS